MNAIATPLVLFLILSVNAVARNGADHRHPIIVDPAKLGGAMEARGEGMEKNIFLPLRKTDVQIHMGGAVIETRIVQEFKNDTRQALEAIYLFPLPSEATITSLDLRVGKRTIHSRVLEKDRAQRVYELAKSGGIKAALLEQERPNLFTTSVANFLPGETVQVRFSYTHTAEFSRGKYSLTFPMTHGPRFIPPDGSVTDTERLRAPQLNPTTDAGHRVKLQVRLAGLPIREVTSNTHPITFRKIAGAEQEFEVRLRDPLARADRDFDIDIFIAEKEQPQLSVVTSKGDGDGAGNHALLSVLPPIRDDAPGLAEPKRDVIFVVDTSGSMRGQSIGQARLGLEKCLNRLTEEDAFTIVRFSNDFSMFTPDLRKATPDHVEAARGYVSQLYPGGGTMMQPALAHALRIPGRKDAMRLVIFLTDGAVGNENSLLRLLANDLGKARLFTIGIGSAPNEFLMRKMAASGRGQCRFIHSHADIASEISDLFTTLGKPVLTDVEVRWKDENGNPLDQLASFPDPCPDVFHQRPLQVVARLPHAFASGRIEVSGTLDGKPVRFEHEIDLDGAETRAGIETLFGRARLDELMQQRLLNRGGARAVELEKAITKLGLDYQLVTPFTSRIAVDNRGSRQPKAPLRRRKVPVHRPHGSTPIQGGDARLKFPRPMFIGTPVAVKLPNLERPGRPRIHLKAPKEAILLSAGKPATSSDPNPIIGDLGMITDGDKDGSDGSYVEFGPGLQWVQIDLGKPHQLFGIVLWHFHKNSRAYLDVIVQISDDPTFKTGVTTIYNNDHDNTAGLGLGRGKDKAWIETNHGRIIDIAGKKARYVRFYSRGNTANEMNHYIEVEVFGLP